MPKEEKEVIEEPVETKDTGEESEPKSEHASNRVMYHSSHVWMMVTGIVVAILLFFALIAVANNIFVSNNNRSGFVLEPSNTTTFVGRNNGYRMRGGGQTFIEASSTTSTSTSSGTTTTSSVIVSGVATSLSGNNFVISGNGTQYTVDTTGDTTYNTTDKKVAVNDSVIVIGTISGQTITATDVRVVNN